MIHSSSPKEMQSWNGYQSCFAVWGYIHGWCNSNIHGLLWRRFRLGWTSGLSDLEIWSKCHLLLLLWAQGWLLDNIGAEGHCQVWVVICPNPFRVSRAKLKPLTGKFSSKVTSPSTSQHGVCFCVLVQEKMCFFH